ncbi:MAG: hypothetical protein MJ107_07590 [Lachnospiraceae bacterium]|nr:hypothetical protein [Lachnospiraceae bacterium]
MAESKNLETQDNKKNRSMILDICVALVAVAVLVVCYFFWGCSYDLPATILAIVVILAGSGILFVQHRRNNAVSSEENGAK